MNTSHLNEPTLADLATPRVDRSRIRFLVASLAGVAALGGCVIAPLAPVPVGVTVKGRWQLIGGRRVWVKARV